MIYAQLAQDGRVLALASESLGPDWRGLSENDPRVLAFQQLHLGAARQQPASNLSVSRAALREQLGELGTEPPTMAGLARSDLALARVLEDLIDVLIDRQVLRFTDLPQAAQDKLVQRRSLRDDVRRLQLLEDDDESDPFKDTMI